MDKWKTICSQALLDTKWVKVRKDAVELPNGQHIEDFYAITINEAAAIVALDDYGNIILKKEYRYCYGRDLIEIPAGGFERGEEGLEVAKRELLEETGYISDDWQFIGRTVESSAKLTNYMHIYFADHCRKVSGQHLDATEEGIACQTPGTNRVYPSYDQIAFITQAAVDGLLTFRSSQEVSL